MQDIWRQVAEEGLNCAVAGTIANIAVTMVKELQFEISTDFPGYSSFDAIVNKAICFGDPESDINKGRFKLGFHQIDPNGSVTQIRYSEVDIMESLMINAYRDLEAFITDFRKNRTGRPTKGLLSSLQWDPVLNLKTVSKQERLKWRSTFAINWLYDFVNTYAACVIRENLDKAQLENYDWYDNGSMIRTMFGPLDFASEITAMSMKIKAGTPASLIMPHHVFILQMCLDSMTVSRGWKQTALCGSTIKSPPVSWIHHSAMKDINTLKTDENRSLREGVHRYLTVLQHDREHSKYFNRHKMVLEQLPALVDEIEVCLGVTRLTLNMPNHPPSRFAATDPNGLWVYSPYLCGTGLADVLQILSIYGMACLEKTGDMISHIHLFNLLKETNNLPREEFFFFENLLRVYGKNVFVGVGGTPPKKNFHKGEILPSHWVHIC